jgi:hypothetical protein
LMAHTQANKISLSLSLSLSLSYVLFSITYMLRSFSKCNNFSSVGWNFYF